MAESIVAADADYEMRGIGRKPRQLPGDAARHRPVDRAQRRRPAGRQPSP